MPCGMPHSPNSDISGVVHHVAMSDLFVVHFEISGATSMQAKRAANAAWKAITGIVGDDHLEAVAERRSVDGGEPDAPNWPGWDAEPTFTYRRWSTD